MKYVIICALIFFGVNASAQLTKQIVEKEFPVLELPYDTKGMLATSYNPTQFLDAENVYFVKAEITTILKKYTNTNLIINEHGKQYAVGRLKFVNRNYAVYIETSVDPENKEATNELFILSLDDVYQPINAQSLGYYHQKFETLKGSQIVVTDHAFATLSDKSDKLKIMLTIIHQEDKMPEDKQLAYSKDELEIYFDEDGYTQQVFKD